MAKAVVYSLFATAFIFFIITFSSIDHNGPKRLHLHRRFGYNIRPPTFDPLVSKIERVAEEKGLSHHNNGLNLDFAAEVAEGYEYLTEGGQLNTTLRLVYLFPFLDRTPKDAFVSFNELANWITRQAVERLDYTTNKELMAKDQNRDLLISFKEYLPQFSDEDIERRGMGHGEAGWWQERFNCADSDHDGFLNFTEFKE